jgi:hypothetical protein
MAIKTFTTGEVLTTSDTNTFLANAGLVYITGGNLSTNGTNFVGCFSDTYQTYRIIVSGASANASAAIYFQLLSGTTAAATLYYRYANGYTSGGAVRTSGADPGTVGWTGMEMVGVNNLTIGACSLDVHNPKQATRTFIQHHSQGYGSNGFYGVTGFCNHNNEIAYDGIRFLTDQVATMGGQVRIYGYRQA